MPSLTNKKEGTELRLYTVQQAQLSHSSAPGTQLNPGKILFVGLICVLKPKSSSPDPLKQTEDSDQLYAGTGTCPSLEPLGGADSAGTPL